jgi:hypothetical protein
MNAPATSAIQEPAPGATLLSDPTGPKTAQPVASACPYLMINETGHPITARRPA